MTRLIVPDGLGPPITKVRLVAQMSRQAMTGVAKGQGVDAYYMSCARTYPTTGVKLIYTRDAGMHTCGWFKNPDYERCYHLSLSFWNPAFIAQAHPTPRAPARGEAEEWVKLFYGDSVRLVWEESAHTEQGKRNGVRHYRVFCDEHWRPILPEGEVYSTAKTELGWLSWSDRKYVEGQARG